MNDQANTEILDAIQGLASHMDAEFAKVRAEMATKDFVERRLEDSEGRMTRCLGEKIDRVDAKLERLVDVLEKKDVLTVQDVHRVVTGA